MQNVRSNLIYDMDWAVGQIALPQRPIFSIPIEDLNFNSGGEKKREQIEPHTQSIPSTNMWLAR